MKTTSSSLGLDPRPGENRAAGVLCRPAEEAFKKGLTALRHSEMTVARALFEAAIQLERRSGAARIQPRYISYYGLSLADDVTRRPMALDCCRRAVKEEFFNPDLFLNLSRVYQALGNRAEAHKAAVRGLALDPKHPGLKTHVSEMGVRRRPPLPFLGRDNFLNVTLGKMLRKGPVRSAPARG
jgi:tetratricopeptide (TPR) repeat protein